MPIDTADAAAKLFGTASGSDPVPPPPQQRSATPAPIVSRDEAQRRQDLGDGGKAQADRLEKLFAYGPGKKPDPVPPLSPPAAAKTTPQATQTTQPQQGADKSQQAQEPGQADDTATAVEEPSTYLDPAHAETATVAPAIKDLGLRRGQVEKLMALRQQLDDQRTQAWGRQSKAAFAAEPHTIADAKQAVSMFGGAELKKVLGSSGLGNHPAVIRTFAKVMREVRLAATQTMIRRS